MIEQGEKTFKLKPKPMCNHCFMVRLVREYGVFEGKKI